MVGEGLKVNTISYTVQYTNMLRDANRYAIKSNKGLGC